MFFDFFTALLARSDRVVKEGARKAQAGQRGAAVNAFARRGQNERRRRAKR